MAYKASATARGRVVRGSLYAFIKCSALHPTNRAKSEIMGVVVIGLHLSSLPICNHSCFRSSFTSYRSLMKEQQAYAISTRRITSTFCSDPAFLCGHCPYCEPLSPPFCFQPPPSSSISHVAPNLILKQKPSYSFPFPPTFFAAAHISFCLSNDSKKCVVRTSMRLTECWRPFRRSSGRGEEGDGIGGEGGISVDVGSGTLDFLHL